MNFSIYQVLWSWYDGSLGCQQYERFIVTASSESAATTAVSVACTARDGGYVSSAKYLGPA